MGKPKNIVYRGRFDRYPDQSWLVWSNKWGAWYRENAQGYTTDIAQAGVFNRSQAYAYYTDPAKPKSHRVTEPFPLSGVKKHILNKRRGIVEDASKRLESLDKLIAVLGGDHA